MGKGMSLLNTVVRELERSAKAAERERARIEREAERRANQLERERIKQAKEDKRLRAKIAREQVKAGKERIKKELEKEEKIFNTRIESRRKLRLKYLNIKHLTHT